MSWFCMIRLRSWLKNREPKFLLGRSEPNSPGIRISFVDPAKILNRLTVAIPVKIALAGGSCVSRLPEFPSFQSLYDGAPCEELHMPREFHGHMWLYNGSQPRSGRNFDQNYDILPQKLQNSHHFRPTQPPPINPNNNRHEHRIIQHYQQAL